MEPSVHDCTGLYQAGTYHRWYNVPQSVRPYHWRYDRTIDGTTVPLTVRIYRAKRKASCASASGAPAFTCPWRRSFRACHADCHTRKRMCCKRLCHAFTACRNIS